MDVMRINFQFQESRKKSSDVKNVKIRLRYDEMFTHWWQTMRRPTVRPNLLSAPMTLDNWLDGRIHVDTLRRHFLSL